MWLVPQLDFSSDDRLHFALFWTVGDQINLVVVRRMEQDAFEFHGKTHQAVRYDFSLGMIRQSLWVQELDGVPTVLKYDTGEYVFYNLSLAEGAAAAPAPEATAAAPEEEAAPAEEAEAEAEEAAEEEETGEEEEPPVLYDDEGNPYIPF